MKFLVACSTLLFVPFTILQPLGAERDSAAAEDDTLHLTPKVVTTKLEATDPLDAAASVSVVRGETLRKRDVRLASEALRGLSNVQVLEQGDGNWTQIIIRGVPHPHGNNNMLVLVDGIPTMMSSDEANLNAVPFDDIERVEVIKGPMSALYGRNAVGGTVNYITRKPPSRLQGEGTMAYGANNYLKPSFRVGGPTGAADNFFSAGGYWLGYDGWRNDADRKTLSLHAKDQWYYSPRGNVQVSANFHNNDQSIVTSVPIRPDGSVVQLPKGNTFNYDGPPGAMEKFYTAQGAAALSQQLGGGFDAKLTAQYRRSLRKYNGGWLNGYIDSTQTIDWFPYENRWSDQVLSVEPRVSWDGKLGPTHNRITLGATGELTGSDPYQDVYHFANGPWTAPYYPINARTGAVPDSTMNYLGLRSTVDSRAIGAYLQWDLKVFEKLTITPGIRFDDYTRKVDFDSTADTGPANTIEGDFSHFSPKLSVSYRWLEGLSTYLAYGQAYAPTFGPIWSFSKQRTLLDPEITSNYEGGIKTRFWQGQVEVSATAFYMHRQDFIAITFDGRGGWNPINAGGQDNRGLEFDLRFDLRKAAPGLSGYLALGATETEYTDYEYDSQDWSTGTPQNVHYNFNGKEAVGVPFHTASVGADYTYARFGVTVGGWFDWQDEYYYTPDNSLRADAVGLLNARLAWRPLAGRNLEFSVVGKNLMDKEHYGIIRNLSPNGWNEAYPGNPFQFTTMVRAGF